MTLLTQKKRNSLPSMISDFFNSERFPGPSLIDFNRSFGEDLSSFLLPDANIAEEEKAFRIELAAPGLERKDFKVNLEGDTLTISCEKEEEKKEERKNYMRREFSYNAFNRSFILPENTLPEKIEAKYENGILNIVIPKKEITISKAAKEIKVG